MLMAMMRKTNCNSERPPISCGHQESDIHTLLLKPPNKRVQKEERAQSRTEPET